jgi:hypothetical protein
VAVFRRRSPIAIPDQTDRRAEPEQRVAAGRRARRAAEREAAQRAAEQAERDLRVARARRRMAQVAVSGSGASAGPATGPIPVQGSGPIALPVQRTGSTLPPHPRSA